MFERFANRFNTCGSCVAANESVSASSSCARANSQRVNTALLLTVDNAFALSIFAILRLIVIRLLGVIIILRSNFSRPVWALAQ